MHTHSRKTYRIDNFKRVELSTLFLYKLDKITLAYFSVLFYSFYVNMYIDFIFK